MTSSRDSFKIATLIRNDSSNETVVKYRRINLLTEESPSGESVISYDELPQTCFVSGWEGKNSTALNKSHSKVLASSYVATYDAAIFLSDNFPRFQSQKKKKGSSKATPKISPISIGHGALVLSRDNSSESTFLCPQFHAVTFSLPQSKANSVTEAQSYRELLMIRQPGLQRSGPMSLSKDLWSFEAFDVIEMCTGMCLFSEQDLDLCMQNGTVQPMQLANLPVSLSEKEIISRLSATIANTMGLYFHGSEARKQHALRINVDIPSVQYYIAYLQFALFLESLLEHRALIPNGRVQVSGVHPCETEKWKEQCFNFVPKRNY